MTISARPVQTPIMIQASIIYPKTENESETPNSPACAPPHDADPSHCRAPHSNAHHVSPPAETPAHSCGNETLSTSLSSACHGRNCGNGMESACDGITVWGGSAHLGSPFPDGTAHHTFTGSLARGLCHGIARVCDPCGLCLSPCRGSPSLCLYRLSSEVYPPYHGHIPFFHSEVPSHLWHLFPSHPFLYHPFRPFHLCHLCLFPCHPCRPCRLCPPCPCSRDTPLRNALCVCSGSTPRSDGPGA